MIALNSRSAKEQPQTAFHLHPPHFWRGDPHQENAHLVGKNNHFDPPSFTKNFKITPHQEKARYKAGHKTTPSFGTNRR